MIRQACIALVLACSCVSAANGQDWARKMFEGTDHNFGAVARGSTVQHFFFLKNIYKEDIHIASVRSSCGCTDVKITKDTLKTYERQAIVASLNTKSFLGQRSATLTVTIDKPYYAEVQLQVSGFIRSDIMLTPPGVAFGSVDQGVQNVQKVEIVYSGGRADWRITDIKVGNESFDAEAVELSRTRTGAKYELAVRLKPTAPPGYLKDTITVVTNDAATPTFPVDVEGQVVAEITVRPSPLFLGVFKPGQKATKQLVVRGKKPFRITAVECPDSSFEFKFDREELKEVHLIPVTFTAGEGAGKIDSRIVIRVDQGTEMVTDVQAQAVVEAAAQAASR